MAQTLFKSSRYAKFAGDRDKALERIHQNTQIDLSRITYVMLTQIENFAASAAIRAGTAYMTHQISVQFENGVRDIMTQTFPILVRRIMNMRRAVYVLTYAGEQEAIGRATQRKAEIGRGEFQKRLGAALSRPTILGPLDKRVWLALMNLRRDIVQVFEVGVTQELSPAEIVQKVRDAFPPIRVYRRAPKALTKVKEAAQRSQQTSWFDFGFIDEGDWDMAVNAYLDTEIAPNRFDNYAQYDPATGVMKYEWELEQETTEDFVKQVKDGKIDAAKDLGVKEFVWIAIIDNHTCDECCLPRNGKTTSEIGQMLSSG